jgi:three-Cys-motif partner protein
MPKCTDPQGQSAIATEMKQRGLTYAFTVNYLVAQKHESWMEAYQHIDLNCGNGYNEKAQCIGSPLTFLKVFRGHPQFLATFVDHDPAQLDQLAEHIDDDPRCSLYEGNNADFLRTLRHLLPERNRNWQLGSILSDPNGSDVPINEIAEVCEIFPRIDVIFHWNSNITKRLKNGIKPEQITLDAVPKILSMKKHWLIREPIGPHQFAMLIGRGYFRVRSWPGGGFYHLDSDKGQEILDRCSRTNKERTP